MNPPTAGQKPPPAAEEPLDISLSGDLLDKLSRHFAEFGDAFRVYAPVTRRDIYVFSHPDHIKHVLITHPHNYTKGIGIDRVGLLLGDGIMVSEGALWRRQRKMIQPAFHPRVIAGLAGQMLEANLELREKWLAAARRGEPVNLTQDTSEVTLQIVLRAIIGEDLDRMTAAHGGNPFSLLTDDADRNLAFAHKFRSLSKLMSDCIGRRRRVNVRRADLLSMLIDSRDRESGQPMPDHQLIDEAMTLIVAGHETTASALNLMWYLLSQHPGAARRLQQEVDTLPRDADSAELERLPYTRQVIQETLRLYPPGWLLTRRAVAADTVGGYAVPAGADVFISPYLVHRHPQFWREPERFDPERFTPAVQAQRHRFAYLPFALGPRACIGEHFAMAEMLIHTALLAREIHLKYVAHQPIALESRINLRTRHSLMMTPVARHSNERVSKRRARLDEETKDTDRSR
jgi:enediyne biosynthesis protein E7